ncbi:J domain-containing protein [Novosphingobium sp. PS1R-30]|uniref:J domain-containing protein n=1 Tax=Novosphingobium anseongense TaxID=3133436 RepID=A0ABU8RVZ8_9SPHN|nr:MAG: J domain-containing protein [Novosphingobium sp.]
MKFLVLIALGVLAFRLVAGRWPWEPRRVPTRSGAKQARVLLGVGEGASREQIIEAHRRLVTQVHPDKGGTSELMHEANSARDLLLAELPVR